MKRLRKSCSCMYSSSPALRLLKRLSSCAAAAAAAAVFSNEISMRNPAASVRPSVRLGSLTRPFVDYVLFPCSLCEVRLRRRRRRQVTNAPYPTFMYFFAAVAAAVHMHTTHGGGGVYGALCLVLTSQPTTDYHRSRPRLKGNMRINEPCTFPLPMTYDTFQFVALTILIQDQA